MRRTLALLAVLLVISAAWMALAHGAVTAWQDDVVIGQTTLLGSAEAAVGLQITVKPQKQERLFWQTTLMAAEEPKPETEFLYYSYPQYDSSEPVNAVYLYLEGLNYGIGGNDIVLEEYESDAHHSGIRMVKPAIDVASRTQAGQTLTEQLYLKDYYEVYPVSLDWSYANVGKYAELDQQWSEKLQQWLSIPVSEDTVVEVSVTRNEAGSITDVDCKELSGEQSRFYGDGFAAEDGLYFYLNGSPAELRNIACGFGIYYMPLETVKLGEEVAAWPNIDAVENIYPMNPESCRVIALLEREDGTLLLLTEESGIPWLTLLTRDGTVKQRLELPDLAEEESYSIWQGENELLVLKIYAEQRKEDRILVLPRENGLYTLWLEAEFPDNEIWPKDDNYGAYYHDPVLAFDGERLAIGCLQSNWQTASFRIMTYDQTGLTYAGFYNHNADEFEDRLETSGSNSLTLRWLP